MIVHFPIALITIGFLADVAYLFFKQEKCLLKTGFYLMIFGTLAACAAFTTGHLFTNEPTQGEIVKIFERHETSALFTLIVMSVGSIFRIFLVIKGKEETQMKWMVFGLYFIGVILVSMTGHAGGTMVYDYMMSL
jgi:uncharacterized membrane protein